MPLTPGEFAAQIAPLRPILLQVAAANCPCSLDDAEDLVCDTVCQALAKLPGFEAQDERALYVWLKSILGIMILRSRRAASRRVETVEIVEALEIVAPPPCLSPLEQLSEDLERLPEEQRAVMLPWLDGYTQNYIAAREHLDRHTVANRIKLASQTLRMEVPDGEDLTYSRKLPYWYRQTTSYHRQNSMARYWRGHHPGDKRF